jgi:hypothetical protein
MDYIWRTYRVALRRLRISIYRIIKFDIFLFAFPRSDHGKYFLDYKDRDYYGYDIRGIWEKNRFQWTLTEAIHYRQRNSVHSIEKITTDIRDWVAGNPVGYGANWLCAMEAAIRLANWLCSYELIKDSPGITQDFEKEFLQSIEKHGQYVWQNLEIHLRQPLNNHFLADVAGLFYLSVRHPSYRRSKRWLKFSKRELEKQIMKQALPDGVFFENSISYHRFALEIFLYCGILALSRDIVLSTAYWNRLEKMLEFVMYYTRPDGQAPSFGDADNGFWHTLTNDVRNNVNSHRYLLGLGAVIFDRADFKYVSQGLSENYSYLLGGECKENWERLREEKVNLESKEFYYGGVYIFRKDSAYLALVTANKDPASVQLHKHNDIFSFELCIGDSPFIIDSGTYCYTLDPLMRNYFRSTEAHNTVRIDNAEQHDVEKSGFFSLPRCVIVKNIKWISNSSKDYFEGTVDRHKTGRSSVTHKRAVSFDKQYLEWNITDAFEGKGQHNFEWFFHLHPLCSTFPGQSSSEKQRVLLIKSSEHQISFAFESRLHLAIEDSWVSLRFGEKTRATVLKLRSKQDLPFDNTILVKILN